jgi:hypothetical protein
MARYHNTDQGVIPFTSDEEAEWDAMELESQRNTEAAHHANAREERTQLLAACDWTQFVDSPLSAEQKAEWALYRQNLRGITTHANWPHLSDDDWPSKPA